MQDLQAQTCAAFLASQFSALPHVGKKVGYLKAKLVCFAARGGVEAASGGGGWGRGGGGSSRNLRWGCVERVLDSGFSKWMNNGAYSRGTDDPEYSATLEAFSHWTHHATGGYLMVTDIQGIRVGDDRFVLSDPAIHCVDGARFGETNLGEDGFALRFSTHKCNAICKALGLPRHPAQQQCSSGVRTVSVGTTAV